MTSIDNNLKSCSPHNDVYTYSFSKAEVDEINEGLKKNDWVTEVRQLIGEQEKEQDKQKIANIFTDVWNKVNFEKKWLWNCGVRDPNVILAFESIKVFIKELEKKQ